MNMTKVFYKSTCLVQVLTNAGLKISCGKSNLVYLKSPSVSRLMFMENFQKLSLVQSPCEHIYTREYNTMLGKQLI